MGIKKLLALLLLVFLCMASISSCKIKGKGDSLDGSDSSNSVTENFIWAKGATLGIVTESGIVIDARLVQSSNA